MHIACNPRWSLPNDLYAAGGADPSRPRALMAALTLDASAVLRVVLESGRQSATIDLLAAVAAVYAPSLFVAETANALWKHVGVGHILKEGARRTGAALLTFDKKLAALWHSGSTSPSRVEPATAPVPQHAREIQVSNGCGRDFNPDAYR